MPLDQAEADTRFYCVHIATDASRSRGTSVCWSRPYPTPSEALQYGQSLLADGRASLVFIVRAAGNDKDVLYVRPRSAEKIIDRYEDLLDSLESP